MCTSHSTMSYNKTSNKFYQENGTCQNKTVDRTSRRTSLGLLRLKASTSVSHMLSYSNQLRQQQSAMCAEIVIKK